MLKILCLLIITLITPSSFATCSKDDLSSIVMSLNQFKTLIIDFSENNKSGKIYIKKPGMMRIDYESPEKISIIIKDGLVTYYDHQLDEITKIKQDPKFLTFLMKNKIDLNKDFDSFKCSKESNNITLDLSILGDEGEKTIIKMHYLQHILNKIDVESQNKNKTTLFFKDLKYNEVLNDNTFKLKDKGFFNVE